MDKNILDSELMGEKKASLNFGLLAFLIPIIGGVIGGTTNWINGKISKEYFKLVMDWNFPNVRYVAIIQGIFEGLGYGIVFSCIFTIGFAWITKMKADWGFTIQQLKKIVLIIYGGWFLGGSLTMLFTLVFPATFEAYLIYILSTKKLALVRFAWVGGSVWGGMIGGVIALIWGLINTKKEWKDIDA